MTRPRWPARAIATTMPHGFLEEKMNIWNDSYDDERRLSKRARAAIFFLAFAALLGAGALGVYRAQPPGPEAMADPAPVPPPARALAVQPRIAAAKPTPKLAR